MKSIFMIQGQSFQLISQCLYKTGRELMTDEILTIKKYCYCSFKDKNRGAVSIFRANALKKYKGVSFLNINRPGGIHSLGLAIKQKTFSSLKEKFNEKELRETVREFDIAGELQALTESEARYILKFGSIDSFRNKIIAEGKAQGRSDLNGVFKEAVQYQIAYHGTTHQ